MQALGVPAEVLAELDHGLAGVALEPKRQPGVLQRHRGTARGIGGRRAWFAGPRAARGRRGTATGSRTRPRPIMIPAQPVWSPHPNDVVGRLHVAVADHRDVQRLDHARDLVPVGLAAEHLGAGPRVQGERPRAGVLHPERDADRIAPLVVPPAPRLDGDRQMGGADDRADDPLDQVQVAQAPGAAVPLHHLLDRAAEVDVDELRAGSAR